MPILKIERREKMSEEQTQSEAQPAPTNTDEGNKFNEVSVIKQTDALVERMEKANKQAEELLKRNEAVLSRMILSGRGEAGSITRTPEEIEAENVKKEADAILNRFK